MKKVLFVILLIIMKPLSTYALNVADYLIDTNIGEFSKSYDGSCNEGAGILSGTDHYAMDHTDYACDVRYYKRSVRLGVEVQVTQHTNSDSDMWLLHEVDADYRTGIGIPDMSYGVRKVDGQTVLVFNAGGRNYRWISGNKVIKVEYHDSQMTKPEPLEIVKAYLAKHPSTIQPFTLAQLRSSESKTKWIKDEMDRRLWICDKWFYQLQLGKVALKDVIWNTVRSMTVFLNYREKYYGIDAENDLAALNSYQRNNDGSSIKLKLQEYKNWWLANKGRGISIQ